MQLVLETAVARANSYDRANHPYTSRLASILTHIDLSYITLHSLNGCVQPLALCVFSDRLRFRQHMVS